MPIHVHCPHCLKRVRVADEWLWKVLRCGGCQQLFRLRMPRPKRRSEPTPTVLGKPARADVPGQPPNQPEVQARPEADTAPPRSPREAGADLPRTSRSAGGDESARGPSRALLLGGIAAGLLLLVLGAG